MTESLTSESDEPKSPSEALNSEHSDQWKEAMDSEYSSLLKNETWELVPPPEGKNIVGSRWILTLSSLGGAESAPPSGFLSVDFYQVHLQH